MDSNGKLLENILAKAEALNDWFAKQFTTDDDDKNEISIAKNEYEYMYKDKGHGYL